MAGDLSLRGVPSSGYSTPVAMIAQLNNAQRDHLPAKDINPAAMWFSGHLPVHETAVTVLSHVDVARLRGVVQGQDSQVLLNETDINISAVRRFLDSDTAKHSGLPDILSAVEFNARVADRTVAIPALFQKNNMPSVKGRERFFAGGNWWTVGFIGISERYSVTLPLAFHLGKQNYVLAVESIARTAERFSSEISIRNEAEASPTVSAKSMFGIIALGIAPGHQVTITTEGPDAKQAIAAMTRRIHALERMSAADKKSKK